MDKGEEPHTSGSDPEVSPQNILLNQCIIESFLAGWSVITLLLRKLLVSCFSQFCITKQQVIQQKLDFVVANVNVTY